MNERRISVKKGVLWGLVPVLFLALYAQLLKVDVQRAAAHSERRIRTILDEVQSLRDGGNSND